MPSAKLNIYWLSAICKAKCVITHMLVVKLQFLLGLREVGDITSGRWRQSSILFAASSHFRQERKCFMKWHLGPPCVKVPLARWVALVASFGGSNIPPAYTRFFNVVPFCTCFYQKIHRLVDDLMRPQGFLAFPSWLLSLVLSHQIYPLTGDNPSRAQLTTNF